MNCAIIYYSQSGKTKKIAEMLKKKYGADMYFVTPNKEYGGYISSVVKVGAEKIKKEKVDSKIIPVKAEKYDVIFIGFPVWYGSMPPFFREYVLSCKIIGKTVIPFVTASAGGKASSLKAVKQSCPNCEIRDYFFSSSINKEDPEKWVEALIL